MNAYATLDEKNKKVAALHKRRQKLQNMLMKENSEYEAELKKLSLNNYSRLQELQDRYTVFFPN